MPFSLPCDFNIFHQNGRAEDYPPSVYGKCLPCIQIGKASARGQINEPSQI